MNGPPTLRQARPILSGPGCSLKEYSPAAGAGLHGGTMPALIYVWELVSQTGERMLRGLVLAVAPATIVSGRDRAEHSRRDRLLAIDGLDGYSYDYPSRGGAEQRALKCCLPR